MPHKNLTTKLVNWLGKINAKNLTGRTDTYLSDLSSWFKVTDELGLTQFIRGNNGSLHTASAEMDLSGQKDFS